MRQIAVCSLLLGLFARSQADAREQSVSAFMAPEAAGASAADSAAALLQWAAANHYNTWRGQDALVVDMPLRLDDGSTTGRLDMQTALLRAWAAAEPAARAAMAEDRVVLEADLGATASAILRAGSPSRLVVDPGRMVLHLGTDEEQRASATRVLGRPLTDEEWAARRAAADEVEQRRNRLPWLDWELGLGLALDGAAEVRRGDGTEVGTVAVFGPRTILPPLYNYVREPDGTLARSGLLGLTQLRAMVEPRLAELTAEPAGVVVGDRGLFTLAELATILSAWRPHAVAPDFAEECLFVSAGEWNPSILAQAVSLASGLLWRHAAEGMTLTTYPAAVVLAPDPATGPWSEKDRLEGAIDGREVPFTPADMVSLEGPSREVDWVDLTVEQQEYLKVQLRRTAEYNRELARNLPDLDDPFVAEGLSVKLRLYMLWQMGLFYEAGPYLGATAYGCLNQTGYALYPEVPMPWP